MAPSLLSLSPEILHQILVELDPIDVASVAQVCRSLSSQVDPAGNSLLWRDLFHRLFDDVHSSYRPGHSWRQRPARIAIADEDGGKPIAKPITSDIDYARLVRERCRARGIVCCTDVKKKIANRGLVLEALADILASASNSPSTVSRNATFLGKLFDNKFNVEDWLTPPKKARAVTTWRPRRRAPVLFAHGGQAVLQDEVEMTEDEGEDDDDDEDGDFEANTDEDLTSGDSSSSEDGEGVTDQNIVHVGDSYEDDETEQDESLSEFESEQHAEQSVPAQQSSVACPSSETARPLPVLNAADTLALDTALRDGWPIVIPGTEEVGPRTGANPTAEDSNDHTAGVDLPESFAATGSTTVPSVLMESPTESKIIANALPPSFDQTMVDSSASTDDRRGVLPQIAQSSTGTSGDSGTDSQARGLVDSFDQPVASSSSSAMRDSEREVVSSTESTVPASPNARKRKLKSSSSKPRRSHPPLPIPQDERLTALACKVHAAGVSLQEVNWTSYSAACCFREIVYKHEHFADENQYGPFKKRQSPEAPWQVDWALLDAVVRVVSVNVKSAWHQWADPADMHSLPYGFEKAVLWKQPGPGRDWANITGEWSYVYSFIDYNDFFAFNFAEDTFRNGISDLEGISEAVGGINTLNLQLADDSIDCDDAGAEEDNPYPPLNFTGRASGPNGSSFKGVVRLLDSGDRHWTFVIRYGGEDRWRTECIEIGGRGCYGVWSDVRHEELSPCGPVWYYRNW